MKAESTTTSNPECTYLQEGITQRDTQGYVLVGTS